MAAKALTLSLNPPACVLQLVIVLSLRDIKVWWRVPSPGFKKMFTEPHIEIASLKSKYEVVKYDTRSDEYYGPLMVL
jgi:hypothetical protein